MKVATYLLRGKHATPALASQAVAKAMQKAGLTSANCVLLYLSADFASNPQPAILAAASTARCTQVMGCSAAGIFTEEDWVLDSPAVAVMVFGDPISLNLSRTNPTHQPLFSLCAPNALNCAWLNSELNHGLNNDSPTCHPRFGGISGDAMGQGPFSVWQNAKGAVHGHVEAYFSGVNMASKASHGLTLLSKPQLITQSNAYDMHALGNETALQSLHKAWSSHHHATDEIPLHRIMAVYADDTQTIMDGNYAQTTVISVDIDHGSVTLAEPLTVGQYISWGLRDPVAATTDLIDTTDKLLKTLSSKPAFGLVFSCLGRGPFNDAIDHDLKVLTKKLPDMPLLGFYGNGEIAHINGKNHVLPYSLVLNLFANANKQHD